MFQVFRRMSWENAEQRNFMIIVSSLLFFLVKRVSYGRHGVLYIVHSFYFGWIVDVQEQFSAGLIVFVVLLVFTNSRVENKFTFCNWWQGHRARFLLHMKTGEIKDWKVLQQWPTIYAWLFRFFEKMCS